MPFPNRLLSPVIRNLSLTQVRGYNGNRCIVTRPMRKEYLRQYPTLLVMPDGSSVTFRHTVPRKVVKMPLMIEDCLTAEAKADWNQRRKRMEKIAFEVDTIEVDFDKNKYLKFMRK